jgi:hypothetical protein
MPEKACNIREPAQNHSIQTRRAEGRLPARRAVFGGT